MNNKENVPVKIQERVKDRKLKYPINNVWLTLTILILCFACFILVFVLNLTIQMPLFLDGLNFIYNYQQSQASLFFKVIQNLISLICHSYVVAVILVLYYILSKRKLMILVHLIYYFYATFLIALIVQNLQQSRPIWYDIRIKNLEWFCLTSFGNPSGHTFTVSILFQPLLSDNVGYLRYHILAIPLIILLVIMPLSRIYLGSHSSNQVLFGLILGFIALILFKYFYQKQLFELCWELLTKIKNNLKIIAIITMHIITIAIPIVFYLFNINHRPLFHKDIVNMNKQCNTTDITSHKVQSEMLVVGCSIGSLPFGFIYGFLLLRNRKKYRSYFLGQWHYQRRIRFILQLIVYIVSAGLPYLFFFLISTYAVKDIPIVNYILSSAGALGVGLGISYFVPILSFKLKIININQKTKRKPYSQQITK